MYGYANPFNLPNIANMSTRSNTENIPKENTLYYYLVYRILHSQEEIKKAYSKIIFRISS